MFDNSPKRIPMFPFMYRRSEFFSPPFMNTCMLYTDFILLANGQKYLSCYIVQSIEILVCLSTDVSYACTIL